MNVKEIIIDYLKKNGFDGLYHPSEDCGCPVGQIALCESSPLDCIPGHKIKCGGGGWHEFDIGPKEKR